MPKEGGADSENAAYLISADAKIITIWQACGGFTNFFQYPFFPTEWSAKGIYASLIA